MTATAATEESELLLQYRDYEERFNGIEYREQVEEMGFSIIEDQVFPIFLESFDAEELYEEQVSRDNEYEEDYSEEQSPRENCFFVPVMDQKYNRLVIFIVDREGRIIYKTNQLATNYLYQGSLEQPTRDIAAVSFQDVNKDELTDIILITSCVNEEGEYAGKTYKTGDVLFQREGRFYLSFAGYFGCETQ